MKSSTLGLKFGILSFHAVCILSAIALIFSSIDHYFNQSLLAQEIPTVNILPESIRHHDILQLSQSIAVRIMKADSAGSGVIISRSGNTYWVLTNWHVVESSRPMILTVDNQQHQLTALPQPLGDADLAILEFHSEIEYPIAQITLEMPQLGDTVYAAGFPLIIGTNSNTTNLGNQAFRLTQGQISIIPHKSLPQGYRLGYTNDTQIGMSGSPILNSEGLLVGIHGRGKYRDPDFGVYLFEDGSEPSPEQLERMVQASWGIPIRIYSEFLNQQY